MQIRNNEEMNGRQGGAFGSYKVGVNTEAACENPVETNAVLTPFLGPALEKEDRLSRHTRNIPS